MLDEAKRILGARFPRAFQDNLFAFLYSGGGIGQRCSVVFAGAQELYSLCKDDTSPIGSRAARVLIPNLDSSAVSALARELLGQSTQNGFQKMVEEVYELTGGHAGLTARLLRQMAQYGSLECGDWRKVSGRIQSESAGLFEVWLGGLTQDARAVHDWLIRGDRMEWSDVVLALREQEFDAPLFAKRAVDQMIFTGIAGRDSVGGLSACNKLYWDVARELLVDVAKSQEEQSVWDLIEQVELTLRSVVREQYRSRWGARTNDMYEKALGARAWLSIQDRIAKRLEVYPRSNEDETFDTLDFTYVGQLITLMCWGKAWDMFQAGFRDRRELEDFGRSLQPVRNDRAHFRTVPDRELRRCRLACEDLLAITEPYFR